MEIKVFFLRKEECQLKSESVGHLTVYMYTSCIQLKKSFWVSERQGGVN
jgi:hypothetical protein